MKYTKAFLKYATLVLLAVIASASLIVSLVGAFIGILGTFLEGNVQYLLLIPEALFCAFMGFVAIDCIAVLVDKWHIE